MELIRFRFEEEPLRRFLGFPAFLYAQDSNLFLLADAELSLHADNPFFAYGEHQNFLAVDGERILGRLTAAVNPRFDRNIGFVGFFAAGDEPDVSKALFDAGEAWLREKGCREVWGPVDLTIWSGYRLMTRGYAKPVFVGEPYNLPYFPALFEGAGFRPFKEWISIIGRGELYPLAALGSKPSYERAIDAGYRFRSSSPSKLEEDLAVVHRLIMASFREMAGYYPISLEEFLFLYEGLRPLLDPELVILVADPRGEPIAFSITLPDVRGDVPRPRYVQQYMGRLPDASSSRIGLGKALFYATLRIIRERKKPFDLVGALMSEGNRSRFIGRKVSVPFKSYALYSKKI